MSSWQEFYSNKEITIMVLLESQIKLKTGDNAPIFQLLGVDNKKHALNDYNNFQGILIIFMCNHCPYVKSKIETLNELYEKFSNKIAIIGINSNDSKDYPEDSFENMKKMAKENEFKFDYLLDETQEIAKKYGAICTPDSFLFNSKKQLVFHGKIDNAMKPDDVSTEKTMIQNIQKLLIGEKIEKDFDPSIGCSIKWKEN
ncbi:MAG: thioredoxin family protein [Nitrosarchaeum sp.]|nr:thioredoxin family protein [Nitrosarchaeum sp.]